MKVGTTIPEEGTVFDWDISEIMERPSCDVDGWFDIADDWNATLEGKRLDRHYPDVVQSIERWGFLRPLTAFESTHGELHFGDGHHRLAAAIDLGMTTVPVVVTRGVSIANDSGEWDISLGKEHILTVGDIT